MPSMTPTDLPSTDGHPKRKRSFLGKLLLGSAALAASLLSGYKFADRNDIDPSKLQTFASPLKDDFSVNTWKFSGLAAFAQSLFTQRFIDDNPDIFEPMHARPEGLKTRFEINARDVSSFAASDTGACVSVAFADYIAPLKQEMQNLLPLTYQLERERQRVTMLMREIKLEQEKLAAEYEAEGIKANPASIRSNVIDNLEQDIYETRQRLVPLEQHHAEIAFGTLEKFDGLILHLYEEGLLGSLPADQLTSAYDMLTYSEATIQSIDSDSTRALYVVTDLLMEIGDPWLNQQMDYLEKLGQDRELLRRAKEWKRPATEDEFKRNVLAIVNPLLQLQFAAMKELAPTVAFFKDDTKKELAYYKTGEHVIYVNTSEKSVLWDSGYVVLIASLHEGAHGLSTAYGALHRTNVKIDKQTELFVSSLLTDNATKHYVRYDESMISYHANPIERLARHAERTAIDYLLDEDKASESMKRDYRRLIAGRDVRIAYQRALGGRDKILCDNFNLPQGESPNFISRNVNRAVLNNPEFFIR